MLFFSDYLIVEKFVCGILESTFLHLDEVLTIVVLIGDHNSGMVDTTTLHNHDNHNDKHNNKNSTTQSQDDVDNHWGSLLGCCFINDYIVEIVAFGHEVSVLCNNTSERFGVWRVVAAFFFLQDLFGGFGGDQLTGGSNKDGFFIVIIIVIFTIIFSLRERYTIILYY